MLLGIAVFGQKDLSVGPLTQVREELVLLLDIVELFLEWILLLVHFNICKFLLIILQRP